MVLHILSIIPPLAAFAYCTRQLLGKGDVKRWVRVCVFAFCALLTALTYHTTCMGCLPPFPFSAFLANMMILSIIPIIYIIVSRQFSLPFQDQYFLWIVGYTVIALPYQVCLLLYPLPHMLPEHWGSNMLILSFNARSSVSISPVGMVIFLQACVAFFRTALMYQTVMQRRLLLTRKIKLFLLLVAVTTILLMLLALTPERLQSTPLAAWLILLGISAIVTTWLLVLGNMTREDAAFTDESQNPVKLSDNSMSSLAAGLHFLINKEKIYLQPALKVDQVARTLGTNRTYLSRVVRGEYDKTFPQLIITLRIEEAKRLLKSDPKIKINEVATRCGFKNSSVFGKAFKEETGSTPLDWRRHPDAPPAQSQPRQGDDDEEAV